MTTTKAPENVLAAIRQGNRFLITGHLKPDGDAVGSQLALARILRQLGKGATVWNRDETPGMYAPLPGSSRIHVGAEPPAGFPDLFDAVIAIECPSLSRSGLEEHLAGRKVINIDHHLGNEHYGEINWVDSSAPSLGVMIHRLAQGLKLHLDADTATCLYLTLVTDTGDFRYSNATAEAFSAAAELVRDGARPEQVSQWLHENRPVGALRLLAAMLGTLELHADGRVATAALSRAMFDETGATTGDTEGLIDHLRSIAGVAAAVLLREAEDGKVRVSLRSRGELDVEQIARSHGGGGHRNAAGLTLEGTTLAAAREQVVGELAPLLGG